MHIDANKFYDHIYNSVLIYGPKIILGIIVLLLGLWVINILGRWTHNSLHRKNVDPTLKPFLVSLISVALRLLLVFFVIEIMGFNLTIFTALVGAFGVAVGLALSGTLQNFASGILILLLKPFVVDDSIITQGLEGRVISIQIFYTIVRTFDNRTVIVPNSKLSNEVIINVSHEGKRRLDMNFKVNNAVDFRQIQSIAEETIKQEKNCLTSPEHRIGVSLLELDGFTVSISVWVKAHGYEDTRISLLKKLLLNVKDAGVKLTGI